MHFPAKPLLPSYCNYVGGAGECTALVTRALDQHCPGLHKGPGYRRRSVGLHSYIDPHTVSRFSLVPLLVICIYYILTIVLYQGRAPPLQW